MKSKSRPIVSAEDQALFRDAVGPVKPLAVPAAEPPRARPPSPVPVQTLRDEAQVCRDLMSDRHDLLDIETGEELFFARPGLQHIMLRRLRRGHYSVGAAIDLHGYNVPQANVALDQFLTQASARHIQCVRIIHGKGLTAPSGRSILKQKVDLWLRQRHDVLAFCSSRAVDGGTGALYVLLRATTRKA